MPPCPQFHVYTMAASAALCPHRSKIPLQRLQILSRSELLQELPLCEIFERFYEGREIQQNQKPGQTWTLQKEKLNENDANHANQIKNPSTGTA